MIVVCFLFLAFVFFVASAILRHQSNKRASYIAAGKWVRVSAKIIHVTKRIEPFGYGTDPSHHMNYTIPCYCYYVGGVKRTSNGRNGHLPKDCKSGMQVLIYIDRQTGNFRDEVQDRWLPFSRLFAIVGGGLLFLTVICLCVGTSF